MITSAPEREELGFADEIKKATRSRPLDLAGQLSIKELAAAQELLAR